MMVLLFMANPRGAADEKPNILVIWGDDICRIVTALPGERLSKRLAGYAEALGSQMPSSKFAPNRIGEAAEDV